jgi:CheY-like chemotaxis protein
MRILFADDQLDTRLLYQVAFTQAGHEVHLAGNGQEAVQAAGAANFDVIVLDIGMPVLNGLEAMHQIRQLPGHEKTPIAMFTGFSALMGLAGEMEEVQQIWTKPMLPGDVLSRLEEMVERRKLGF